MSFSSTSSLVVFTQRQGRLDMFDAGIPFSIPNVSAARNRNFINPSPSISANGSGGNPSPQSSSGNLLAVQPLPVRRVSAAGDFYIPGEQTPIGKVNPDLYQNDHDDDWESMGASSQHMGRLWFSVEFNSEQEDLQVNVIKAFSKYNRNPPSQYDTYVRVYLLPDDSNFFKTKVLKKTAMPTFEEKFIFKVQDEDLDKRQLKFTMYEYDRGRKRYMTSFTVFSLKNFDRKQVKKMWQNLKPSLLMDKFGCDLQMAICHEKNFNKLNVTIMDARNVFLPSHRLGFNNDEPSTSLNCYVRVALKKGDKEMKVKTTRNLPVADTSVLIKFNQQLQFTVRKDTELVSNTWLLVELFVKSANLKEELVGELSIGPENFSSGACTEQWISMCNKPNQQIRMWHKLDYFPTRPN